MFQDSYLKSFLEIPVVLGVALCQSKLLKSYYFKESLQQSLRKNELTNSIRSTIFALPDDTNFFEFSVQNYHAYLYQLNKEYRFLALVLRDNNVVKSFRAKQLCIRFQEDIDLTIKIFNELSKNDLLSEHFIQEVPAVDNIQKPSQGYGQSNPEIFNELELDLILSALNYLSHFVSNYLGQKITSNFWNISRPENEWLFQFEINCNCEIKFRGDRDNKINSLAILSLREWTRRFMNQCCKLIHDLPKRLEKEIINEDYRKIIAIYTPEYLQEMRNFSDSISESLFGENLL
jgi:hypothetical protein